MRSTAGAGVGVRVGGTGVAVGGTRVLVGSGVDVAVGGTGVRPDGMVGAKVGRGVALCATQQPDNEKTISVDVKKSSSLFFMFIFFSSG
jgi:hypothetical protein